MTAEKQLHPLAVLRFLRKTLALYFLPLLQVLAVRNWGAFWLALRQDAALFALLCGLSWGLLQCCCWQLDERGTLHLRWKLGLRLETTLRPEALAAVTLEQTPLLRLLGAARITLYPIGQARNKTICLCLRRTDAEFLADHLLPLRDPLRHTPTDSERLSLALLGANGLSTLALALWAMQQTRAVSGRARAQAASRIGRAAAFAARWLPAGVAWFLTLAVALLGLSLARSFAHTFRCEVWRTENQLGSRSGLLSRFECRMRYDQISYADVRLTPAAWLLRRQPVYLAAGCCTPELPFFVCRPGEEALLRAFLPGFVLPPPKPRTHTRRSLIFFAPAGIPFFLFVLLALVSRTVLPALTTTLLLPAAYFLLQLCGALVGYRQEGIRPYGSHLTLRRQQGLTIHCICVFYPAPCLHIRQSPWAVQAGRATLTLRFPGGLPLRVRSIPWPEVQAVLHFLEGTI